MIAVISMKFTDDSTIRVMEWIARLGGDCIRFNVEDIPKVKFGTDPEGSKGHSFLIADGRTVPLAEIRSVWFRRSAPMDPPALGAMPDGDLRRVMQRHMRAELKAAATSLYDAMSHAHWLSHPTTAAPPKLGVLKKARAHGLDIPPTLVTNDKQTLVNFRREHGEIIVKCIADGDLFERDGQAYAPFTNLFQTGHIESLPDTFFPVLVQKKIEKEFEIRTFYLNGNCYSMAIFSQSNEQTRIDFRHYDFENPNRNVPYLLEQDLDCRIVGLMTALSLNTGSLDLIRGIDGKTYFLEVNPVGMFGMVSFPCNLHLRKKLAEFLIAKDRS